MGRILTICSTAGATKKIGVTVNKKKRKKVRFATENESIESWFVLSSNGPITTRTTIKQNLSHVNDDSAPRDYRLMMPDGSSRAAQERAPALLLPKDVSHVNQKRIHTVPVCNQSETICTVLITNEVHLCKTKLH